MNTPEPDAHQHDGHLSPRNAVAQPVSTRRERRLLVALALNGVIVVAQVIFGIAAHSLGLLADAGHNLTDVAAIAASVIAVRWARRPATGQRSFGYHRATILAAQANAASILAITAYILYEGVRRLLNPEPVDGAIIVIVAGVAALANLAAALAVREQHAGHGHAADLNMRSAMLHLIGDTAASVGVVVAGVIILMNGGAYWLDPLVSMAIGLLIAHQAWKLLRSTTDVLLESTPEGVNDEEVSIAITAVDGVEQVHDLHVWSLSSEMRLLSAHLVLDGHPTLEEAQLVGAAVKRTISQRFSIAHATLELECEACSDIGVYCAIEEPADVHQHP